VKKGRHAAADNQIFVMRHFYIPLLVGNICAIMAPLPFVDKAVECKFMLRENETKMSAECGVFASRKISRSEGFTGQRQSAFLISGDGMPFAIFTGGSTDQHSNLWLGRDLTERVRHILWRHYSRHYAGKRADEKLWKAYVGLEIVR